MASIQDVANIFVSDTLDLFNAMEAAVAAGGDVAGAQQRLNGVMQQIIEDKQSSSGSDPSAETDTTRGS
jgi:hypothetical protein